MQQIKIYINMTKEEKDLLLKDLTARLPYKVKAQIPDNHGDYTSVIETVDIGGWVFDSEGKHLVVENIKPYLFPLLSMTEEQEKECQNIKHSYYYDDDSFVLFDWYNKNHFDYRGLIEKSLALDATGLNIY